MKKILLILIAAVAAASCTRTVEEGVSLKLARSRSAQLGDVRYALSFDIPSCLDSSVQASEKISFTLRRKSGIVLDARGFEVKSIIINGKQLDPKIVKEHIVVPASFTRQGGNELLIEFTAGEQSLNRREKFLYTLLVPDRARTLFPCFDQPDIKARYTLTLTVPEGWSAVSNTAVTGMETVAGRHRINFGETEPLSTYLFSFAAGEFQCVSVDGIEAAGQPIHIYHRETDEAKVAECAEVLRLVRSSIDWLEDYTAIPYPFAKYDLVVLPDFQYGGMEHTGATLYNDRRIFLSASPTTEEILDRAQLIAHETAHMWFGDLVTMRWFNDVWTKEVFANYFAAKMVRPLFPEVDHHANDLKTYYAPAYSEDRTIGANAIQRRLENLNKAGLIYCNTIYDKSPVVMGMLEEKLGAEAFREGIREYLSTYAYGNADWDDLIAILDRQSRTGLGSCDGIDSRAAFDVNEWSRVWIKEKGMPVYDWEISEDAGTGTGIGEDNGANGSRIVIRQSDPFGGNIWPQTVEFTFVGKDGEREAVKAVFNDSAEVCMELPFEIDHVIPNSDARAYGWFRTDNEGARALRREYMLSLEGSTDEADSPQSSNAGRIDGNSAECGEKLTTPAARRLGILMTLYENAWHRFTPDREFAQWAALALDSETNTLLCSSLLSYGADASLRCGGCDAFEEQLLAIVSDQSREAEIRTLALRKLMHTTTRFGRFLFMLWLDEKPFNGLEISESDRTSLAYELMVRYPEAASEIRNIQAGRISNPDRRETFMYVSQACAATTKERDAFFESLLSPETRSDAESRVTAALALLNHPLREQESVKYIRPALDALEQVQRTGDIFFPASWCRALLDGHSSREASDAVKSFIIDRNDDLDPLLMTKVLQTAGWLIQ